MTSWSNQSPDEHSNFDTFRDCFGEPVLKALARPVAKPRKQKRVARKSKDDRSSRTGIMEQNDAEARQIERTEEEQTTAEDLGEFVDVSLRPILHTDTDY